jgi:hypothetical protein
MALLALTSGCAWAHHREASLPVVPAVASIPVAPVPSAAEVIVVQGPPPGANPPEAPPVAVEPESPGQASPASPVPRVVLVDELPYRWPYRPVREAKDSPERARAPSQRRHRAVRAYHPDPGIVVDLIDAQGGVPASDLQRAARNLGYWPFRWCYEEGLRRDQRLAGRVAIDIVVSPSGAVERAEVASHSLSDESVALCINREALHLTLATPGESPTTARMDVTLSTGDEPVPVPHPLPNADALREALRASWPAVEQCYATELPRRPDAGGRMELRFRATSSGEIVEVAEGGERRFADVGITRCVLGVYRTTHLPSESLCNLGTRSFLYAMHLESKR